jgi:excisionase family DNA binding protein
LAHGASAAQKRETIMTHQILLTVQQAAARLQISVDTLNRWRITGEGPPFLKYGPRLVRYDEADLAAWGRGRSRFSTSEQSAPKK